MDKLILTRQSIEADIAEYQARIQAARDSLAALPVTQGTLKERKRVDQQRSSLLSEIAHVRILIGYANDALEEEGISTR